MNAAVLSTKLLAPTDSALIAALLNALVLARVPLFVFGSLQASLLNGLSAALAVGTAPRSPACCARSAPWWACSACSAAFPRWCSARG